MPNQYDNNALSKTAAQFAASAKLSSLTSLHDCFRNYRIKTDFSDIAIPGSKDDTLGKQFSKLPEDVQERATGQLNQVFEVTQKTRDAINKYEATLEAFALTSGGTAKDLLDTIDVLQNETKSAIQEQHQEELSKLQNLINKDDFKEILDLKDDDDTVSNKQTADEKLKTVQKTMIDTLKANQAKELEALNEPINKLKKEQEKLSEEETLRVGILHQQYENNRFAKANIDSINQQKAAKTASTNFSISNQSDPRDDSDRYKGIKLTDIPAFKTSQGTLVRRTASNQVMLQLPMFHSLAGVPLFGLNFYYRNIGQEMLELARVIRAEGHKTIEWTIQNPDTSPDAEKYSLELARQQYEAARSVGFTEKDITFIINGEKKTVEEIFKDQPAAKNLIDKQASAQYSALKSSVSQTPSSPVFKERFKQNIQRQLDSKNNPQNPATVQP